MNQTTNQQKLSSPKDTEAEGRRDAIRKLGKYAAYAAPFTVLATNIKAGPQGGTGSGGRRHHR